LAYELDAVVHLASDAVWCALADNVTTGFGNAGMSAVLARVPAHKCGETESSPPIQVSHHQGPSVIGTYLRANPATCNLRLNISKWLVINRSNMYPNDNPSQLDNTVSQAVSQSPVTLHQSQKAGCSCRHAQDSDHLSIKDARPPCCSPPWRR